MKKYRFIGEVKRTPDEHKEEMKKRILKPRPEPYHFEMYQPKYEYKNSVRDYFSSYGSNPNERPTPPPHIDGRTVYIDNASDMPVAVGINNDPFNAPEKQLFSLQPEEGRYILINSYGGSPQYLWPFYTKGYSPTVPNYIGYTQEDKECHIAGPPRILANNANSFVIKRGVEGVWILTFQYPTPRGAS